MSAVRLGPVTMTAFPPASPVPVKSRISPAMSSTTRSSGITIRCRSGRRLTARWSGRRAGSRAEPVSAAMPRAEVIPASAPASSARHRSIVSRAASGAGGEITSSPPAFNVSGSCSASQRGSVVRAAVRTSCPPSHAAMRLAAPSAGTGWHSASTSASARDSRPMRSAAFISPLPRCLNRRSGRGRDGGRASGRPGGSSSRG